MIEDTLVATLDAHLLPWPREAPTTPLIQLRQMPAQVLAAMGPHIPTLPIQTRTISSPMCPKTTWDMRLHHRAVYLPQRRQVLVRQQADIRLPRPVLQDLLIHPGATTRQTM